MISNTELGKAAIVDFKAQTLKLRTFSTEILYMYYAIVLFLLMVNTVTVNTPQRQTSDSTRQALRGCMENNRSEIKLPPYSLESDVT